MQTLFPHKITLFNKVVEITDRTVFRVETTRRANQEYQQVFFSADPLPCISFYLNTTMPKGGKVRIVVDGDTFKVLNRKSF
jgi:hypothetical protein